MHSTAHNQFYSSYIRLSSFYGDNHSGNCYTMCRIMCKGSFKKTITEIRSSQNDTAYKFYMNIFGTWAQDENITSLTLELPEGQTFSGTLRLTRK